VIGARRGVLASVLGLGALGLSQVTARPARAAQSGGESVVYAHTVLGVESSWGPIALPPDKSHAMLRARFRWQPATYGIFGVRINGDADPVHYQNELGRGALLMSIDHADQDMLAVLELPFYRAALGPLLGTSRWTTRTQTAASDQETAYLPGGPALTLTLLTFQSDGVTPLPLVPGSLLEIRVT
jgi:hypothetical protein